MSKAQKATYENLIADSYHTQDLLPPLWQVIYQEAIRANHIIFHAEDVIRFNEETSRTYDSLTLDRPTPRHIRDSAYALFTAQSLADMRRIIASLDWPSRRMIFKIYLNLIMQLRKDIKAGLN